MVKSKNKLLANLATTKPKKVNLAVNIVRLKRLLQTVTRKKQCGNSESLVNGQQKSYIGAPKMVNKIWP